MVYQCNGYEKKNDPFKPVQINHDPFSIDLDFKIGPIYFFRSFRRPRSCVRICFRVSNIGFICSPSAMHALRPWRGLLNNLETVRSFSSCGSQNSSRISDMHSCAGVLASPARPQGLVSEHLHLGYHCGGQDTPPSTSLLQPMWPLSLVAGQYCCVEGGIGLHALGDYLD